MEIKKLSKVSPLVRHFIKTMDNDKAPQLTINKPKPSIETPPKSFLHH